MHRWRVLAGSTTLAVTALVASACADADPSATSGGASESPGTSTPGGSVDAAETPKLRADVVLDGLDDPLDVVAAPGIDGALLIAERPGVVRLARSADDLLVLDDEPVLDISDRVESSGGEQGLLGIAVSPDGSKLYASYSASGSGATRLEEYPIRSDGNDLGVEADSPRLLLTSDQPYPNHNGGGIVFGPDDMLYLGLGDGGAGGDPEGNAQDLSSLLGKLLRLDPAADDLVPTDNPFVDTAGARPEIWSLGLRNPWRFTFDETSGDLWIADVGQSSWEEVNRVSAPDAGRGVNFGWDLREGREDFPDAGPAPEVAADGDLVDPVHVYGRDDGCSITGGIVAAPGALDGLDGAFLFADLCATGLRALVPDGDEVRELRFDLPLEQVVGFGADSAGTPYAASINGTVSRISSER